MISVGPEESLGILEKRRRAILDKAGSQSSFSYRRFFRPESGPREIPIHTENIGIHIDVPPQLSATVLLDRPRVSINNCIRARAHSESNYASRTDALRRHIFGVTGMTRRDLLLEDRRSCAIERQSKKITFKKSIGLEVDAMLGNGASAIITAVSLFCCSAPVGYKPH